LAAFHFFNYCGKPADSLFKTQLIYSAILLGAHICSFHNFTFLALIFVFVN